MSKKHQFLLQANNIHTGGGDTLLNLLLANLSESAHVFLDSRKIVESNTYSFEYIKPNLFSRLRSEFSLKRLSKNYSYNLIFTNLPPLFRLKGRTALFLQNAILLNFRLDKAYGLKVNLRLFFERVWLRMFIHNVDEVVVQSNTMRASVEDLFGEKVEIRVIPFCGQIESFGRRGKRGAFIDTSCNHKFVFVASGDTHKNHKLLVDAWIKLANKNIYPVLFLTLDNSQNAGLVAELEDSIREYNLRVTNLGKIDRERIESLYKECHCLIFPSLKESFGLPLIEARCAGLDIIASELDYVRDLIDPEESFNPKSSTSIARAVCRYLNLDYSATELVGPTEFLNKVFR